MAKLRLTITLLAAMLLASPSLHAAGKKLSSGLSGEIGSSSVFPALSTAVAAANQAIISSRTKDGTAAGSVVGIVVYGVHVSTNGGYLVFLNTGTIGGAAVTTKTAVSLTGTNGNTNGIIHFDPPLEFRNGLVTRVTAACPSDVTGWCYTVLYDELW